MVDINKPSGEALTMDDEFTPSSAWTVAIDLTMHRREAVNLGRMAAEKLVEQSRARNK